MSTESVGNATHMRTQTGQAWLSALAGARARSLAIGGLVALGLTLSACGGEETGAATPAPSTSTPVDATPAAAPAPTPTAAAPKADPCAPPEGSLRGDAAAGAATYAQLCIVCHGPDAPPLTPKPADHQSCEYMTALSDEHLYRTVCGGGAAVGKSPTMPVLGLAPPQIKNVVAHLRTLCPTP